MELNPVLKKILESLEFSAWYQQLSDTYQTTPAFTDFSRQEALEMIMEFGFARTTYNPSIQRYILETCDVNKIARGLSGGLELILEGGKLDVMMIFAVDASHQTGGLFSTFPKQLSYHVVMPLPQFSNYKELYALLKRVF